jgi:hypothetical protein
MMAQKCVRRESVDISLTLPVDVMEWAENERGDMTLSEFIGHVMKHSMEGKPFTTCDIASELKAIEKRLKRLEDDIHEITMLRTKKAGKLGEGEHVSPLSTRPKDVFGELVTIKNVSAKNAQAVFEEIIPFMVRKNVIDRDSVLKELFPRTRSTISNNINYWYNACKGVLDHLVERGLVEKLEKNRYKWIGSQKVSL